MNLIVRLIKTIFLAILRPGLSVMGASKCTFTVLPNDLDINLHMNNGRYLQIMDLGRIDWLLRTGILQNALAHKRRLLLGGVTMRYLRELRVFEQYQVITHLVGWDARFFYIEHRFENKRGQLVALGAARAAMRSEGTHVLPRDVALDHGQYVSPDLPEYITAWNSVDHSLRQHSAVYAEEHQEEGVQERRTKKERRKGVAVKPAQDHALPPLDNLTLTNSLMLMGNTLKAAVSPENTSDKFQGAKLT